MKDVKAKVYYYVPEFFLKWACCESQSYSRNALVAPLISKTLLGAKDEMDLVEGDKVWKQNGTSRCTSTMQEELVGIKII